MKRTLFCIALVVIFSVVLATKLGVEVADRPGAFADAAKTLRPWQSGSKSAPTDKDGWPTTDAFTVIFDDRPAFAWAPPMDDPEKRQPDEGGIYHMSFKGQATVSVMDVSPIVLQNLHYDATSGITTADINMPHNSTDLIVLSFTNTKRTPTSPSGSGITELKVYRPGVDPSSNKLWMDYFLNALKPFDHLRFMGWLGTNYNAGYYGDQGHHLISWEQRPLPTDATQQEDTTLRPGKHGVSWEYIMLLANEAKKDIWINIPVSATGGCNGPDNTIDKSSYLYQLALLLKNGNQFTANKGLNPDLKIYIEHSNEVWNYGFSQYIWNKLAAVDEVNKGGSPLNNDGVTDQEQWARRRHAKCLVQIGKYFADVFGAGSLNNIIRPVYAHWTIFPDQYNATLSWVQKTYGAPSNSFWGLAQSHYFDDTKAGPSASIQQILQVLKQSSMDGVSLTKQINQISKIYNLKQTAYEAGPGTQVGLTVNVGNRIEATRNPGITPIVVSDIVENWWALGGDLYNYFSLSGAYSRYGCWGATDDLNDIHTAKFEGIYQAIQKGAEIFNTES